MKLRMTLQKRSVLGIAVILFIAIGINTLVLMLVTYDKYKDAILSKNAAIGRNLEKEVSKVLSFGLSLEDVEGLDEKLKEIPLVEEDVSYAMVIDIEGAVIYHSDQTNIGKKLKDEVTLKTLSSKVPLTQSFDSFFDLSFPLLDAEDNIVGVLRIGVKAEYIKAQIYELILWAFTVATFIFLLAIGVIYFAVSTFFTKPISKVVNVFQAVSNGDLTRKIKVRSADEIGQLSISFNQLVKNLQNMVSKITSAFMGVNSGSEKIEEVSSSMGEISKTIDNIVSNIADLSSSTEESTSSISEMSTSIDEVAESAENLSSSVDETSSSIEEMTVSIKQIANNTEILMGKGGGYLSVGEAGEDTVEAKRAGGIVGEGAKSVQKAVEGINKIKDVVLESTKVIKNLGDKSEDIGEILTVIDDVAEQTNLLALNAAIIAAQAGEHGKGFAVVADEIRELAERTASSTKEIANLIKGVQAETKNAVLSMEEGSKSAIEGVELIDNVDKTLQRVTQMTKEIARATREQTRGGEQIMKAVENMRDQAVQVKKATVEQSKGSKQITKSSEEALSTAQAILKSTEDGKVLINSSVEAFGKAKDILSEQITLLKQEIDKFKIDDKEKTQMGTDGDTQISTD